MMQFIQFNGKRSVIKLSLTTGLLMVLISIWTYTSCLARSSEGNKALEGKWLIEFAHRDIGLARTVIRVEAGESTFTAYTRKNADKDILGKWTSFLGRTFTKSMKNGSLLRIENGIFKEVGDTLHLAAILVTPMGSFNMEGYIVADSLYACIRTKSRGQIGSLKGSRQVPGLPMEDYAALFSKSVELTEQRIYNRAVLQSGEWKSFVRDMEEITPKLQDDLEMIFAFFYKARNLPFSHYFLMKPMKEEQVPEPVGQTDRYLYLEEKNRETAYLKITSFTGTAAEVDSVFAIIHQKQYQNLIVDLRNNSGGSVEAAMAFATSVTDTMLYGGVFLTQKWFNRHSRPPAVTEYAKFPHFTEANFDLIIEGIHNTDGLCLKIIPSEPVFRGKLYMLTNGGTASACEPIVYELQKRGRVVIIGEKTAGAMLNGEQFDLDRGFKMFIPTADFYTSDGFKIDKNGVKPDIETRQEDALNVALRRLHP